MESSRSEDVFDFYGIDESDSSNATIALTAGESSTLLAGASAFPTFELMGNDIVDYSDFYDIDESVPTTESSIALIGGQGQDHKALETDNIGKFSSLS